jgi:glycosyltransferase involved in cell wall biosynthesis
MPIATIKGGAERMLLHLLQEARDKAEWEVCFLEDGHMVSDASSLGTSVWVLPSGRLRQLSRYCGTVWRLSAHLRRSRYDCVIGWMGKAHIYSGPAAILAHTPALWYQLGVPSKNNFWDRNITRIPARGIIAVSQKSAAAQSCLHPKRPIQVVFHGTDLSQFDPSKLPTPAEARAQLGLPQEGPLIEIVGRLQRWKGMHTLIEAMPTILRSYPEAHAVIVGGEHALEPDYPAYLRQRIEALGLQNRVILAGFQKNVEQWIQACDVFVHAADNEPSGLIITEAMALGKPVVAGAEGGPREIITEGVDGLFAPFGQPEALAQAVLRYLQNPEFARQVGEAARRRAQEFSIQRYAQRFVEAVQTLLSG